VSRPHRSGRLDARHVGAALSQQRTQLRQGASPQTTPPPGSHAGPPPLRRATLLRSLSLPAGGTRQGQFQAEGVALLAGTRRNAPTSPRARPAPSRSIRVDPVLGGESATIQERVCAGLPSARDDADRLSHLRDGKYSATPCSDCSQTGTNHRGKGAFTAGPATHIAGQGLYQLYAAGGRKTWCRTREQMTNPTGSSRARTGVAVAGPGKCGEGGRHGTTESLQEQEPSAAYGTTSHDAHSRGRPPSI
jgi:hypothetical protein